LTINRDAYPTNRTGFSLGHYGYYPGNMIAEAGSYSNGTAANLYPRRGGGTTPMKSLVRFHDESVLGFSLAL